MAQAARGAGAVKVKTTTERRKTIEQLIAPQLHTLYHRRTQKRLRLVAIPALGGKDGAYVRQCYAEAFLDFLEQNNLLVVRKPTTEQLTEQGIELDLEPADLRPIEQIPAPRIYHRIRPGENNDGDDNWWQPGDPEPELPPAVIAQKTDDDDPADRLEQRPTPTDAAREAFHRTGRRGRAITAIRTILPPFLRKLACAVVLVDDADQQPDNKPTKFTLHIELPHDTIGASK
jgi:hypothetical protein